MKKRNTKFNDDFPEEVYTDNYKFTNDKDINDTHFRLAKALSDVEPKDLRPKYLELFLDILENFSFVPGGRITSNIGTGRKGTTAINCFVDGFDGKNQDSMLGILDALRRQALILKSEGGYGVCADVLRPRFSDIEGTGTESPGAVTQLEMWDTQSRVITKGSGNLNKKKGKKKQRKGAQMATMSIWHPDIAEFIISKQTPGRLTRFNMSVLISDSFMDAVKNNNPWDLIFPDIHDNIKRYDKEWDGNIKKWRDKGYPVTIYKSYENANELWTLLMESTYNRNEPGVLFVDTINRLNNLSNIEYITATNPCLTGETLVSVADGRNLVSIKELADKGDDVPVFCYDNDNNIVVRTMMNPRVTGISNKIYKLTFKNGSIRATGNHKFLTLEGNYKEVIDLNTGDDLYLWTEKAEINSNRIIKIEEDGYDVVYNGTVGEFHNFFIGGFESFYSEDSSIYSYFNNKNCGEQLLPRYGACLLSSINLTQFVKNKKWDYKKLENYIPSMIRLMDNVIEVTNLPLKEQKKEMQNKRRIGLGYLGYGSALMMMDVKYGSEDALKLTDELAKFVVNKAYQASALLAKEKGAFPLYNEKEYLNSEFVKMALTKETISLIKKYGIRNSHITSIQPTGNSSIFANLVSGGLEPLFSTEYFRTVTLLTPPENLLIPENINWELRTYDCENEWSWINEGDETLLRVSHEDITYKIDKERGLLKEVPVEDYGVTYLKSKNKWDKNNKGVVTAFDLTLEDHVSTLEVFSRYVDSAMSKTINLPNEFPFEKFKNIYVDIFNTRTIKGCTTYRAGTMASVLSTTTGGDIIKKGFPKRPKGLPCIINQPTVLGEKWIVLIGLLVNDPYEVFAFPAGEINLKKDNGVIFRQGKRTYSLVLDDGTVLDDLNDLSFSSEHEALSRMISMTLRHGADISYIVAQLMKTNGSVVSFEKAIARSLKKFLKEVKGVKCTECGSDNLIMQEGCFKCSDCGNSKCD